MEFYFFTVSFLLPLSIEKFSGKEEKLIFQKYTDKENDKKKCQECRRNS